MSSGSSRVLRYASAGALGASLIAAPVVALAAEAGARASEGSEQDRDEARRLAMEALDLMEAKRWQEANVKLERAYALFKAPTVAVLSARALENVGKLVEAQQRYQEAAATAVDRDSPTPFRKAVREAKREAERLSAELPHLIVRVEGADASQVGVTLDGQALHPTRLGQAMAMNPGEHTVSARLKTDTRSPPGFGVHKVMLERGDTHEITLARIVEPASVDTAPPASPSEPPRQSSNLAWVSLGVGAAGLVTGVAAGAIMLDAKSDLDRNCKPSCPANQRSKLNRFRSARDVSFVGYSVGLVGLGLGIALLVENSGTQSSPVVAIGNGGAQVGYWGRF